MGRGEQSKEEEMSSDDWKYGIYITFNIFDRKWYAFSREDSSRYWTGEPCYKGSGYTATDALNDYNGKQDNRSTGDQEQS